MNGKLRKRRGWRITRIVFALVSFIAALLSFGVFPRLAPLWSQTQAGAQIARWMTGFVGGALLAFAVVLLSAALLGRVYCAVICPLGILQDGIGRIFRWVTRRPLKSQPDHRAFRYGVALAAFTSLAFGWAGVLWAYLDPYSVFGSMASGFFTNAYTRLNNLLTASPVPVQPDVGAALLPAISFLIVLSVLVFWRPRSFCTLLCPVGTLLGACSRRSPVRIRMNEACVGCMLCAKTCPTGCIDVQARRVDNERCIRCMNCLSVCPKGALTYGFAPKKEPESAAEAPLERITRRAALKEIAAAGSLCLLGGSGAVWASGRSFGEETLILPPGAGNLTRFRQACTNCQLCVSNCLGNVLRPTGTVGVVHLRFDKGMCEFNCTACTDVCPTGALPRLAEKKKKLTRIGLAELALFRCVTVTDGTDCGACAEHCPTGALRMKAEEGSILPLPYMTPELCIGCGNCEYACPVRPIRAITVEPVQEQTQVTDPDDYFKPAEEPPPPSADDDWAF